MPSLSIDAGSNRPSNRWVTSNEWCEFWYDTFINGSLSSSLPLSSNQFSAGTDVYFGRDLPNYHKRKNNGELLPMTLYIFCTQALSNVKGQMTWDGYFNGNPNHYSYRVYDKKGLNRPYLPFDSHPGVFTFATVPTVRGWIDEQLPIEPSQYVQAAAAKLYGQGWDVLTFLAEFRHVLRMFKNIVHTIKTAFKSPKDLQNAWLEGRYGWRVLVFDILDATQAILAIDEEQRLRAKERTGWSTTWNTQFTETKQYYTRTEDRVINIDHELSVRGSIVADFVAPTFSFNPVVTAWELVTLSFVIDWVINVGCALNALSFLALSGDYTAAWSLNYKHVRTYENVVTPKLNFNYQTAFSATEEVEFRMRRPCTVPLIPTVNVRLDEFKVIDLIALLLQRIT